MFLHSSHFLLKLQLYYLFKVEFSDVSDIPNLDCISTFGKYGSGNPNLGSGQPNPPIKVFLTTSWEIWNGNCQILLPLHQMDCKQMFD